MKFGIFFPRQLPRPWHADAEETLFHDALDIAEFADSLGIQYGWAQEHHFLEEYSHSTAPEVFLGACSQRTQKMRLGFGISVMPPGVNHPARVAERVATLDLVSHGRVEWGTGEMSSRIELEGFQLSYVDKRTMWLEAVREASKMLECEPYPGYAGEFFTMPCRNVVPKPVQRPHPPIWVACTNRETVRLAARLGLGALTFAFMTAGEAKFWVNEYYSTFEAECQPLGRSVNPNIAMLVGLMCHPDSDVAMARGIEGQQFFYHGLYHYYRKSRHQPGRTDLWTDFLHRDDTPMAGLAGVGSPGEIAQRFAEYEEAGVDQLILLHQGGKYPVDHMMDSLNTFGTKVLPQFIERDQDRAAAKTVRYGDVIEQMNNRVEPVNPSLGRTVTDTPATTF